MALGDLEVAQKRVDIGAQTQPVGVLLVICVRRELERSNRLQGDEGPVPLQQDEDAEVGGQQRMRVGACGPQQQRVGQPAGGELAGQAARQHPALGAGPVRERAQRLAQVMGGDQLATVVKGLDAGEQGTRVGSRLRSQRHRDGVRVLLRTVRPALSRRGRALAP